MYFINKKNNYKLKILPLSIYSSKAKNKKPYEMFEDNKIYYLVLDEKNFKLDDFLWNLRSNLQIIKKSINVDFDAFIKLLKLNDVKNFAIGFISTFELIHHLPFNLKSKYKEIEINVQCTNKNFINNKVEIDGIVNGFNFARELQLRPNNCLSPKMFVNSVLKILKPYKDKIEINVLDVKKLKAKKMGLILAVGQASSADNFPYLLSVKFKKRLVHTALVGKGITFDTGGLNLKPSPFLTGMQYDMSGAAIVIGILLSLLKSHKTLDVGFVIPLSNNDIGPNSIKVGDVVKSYSTKTVEITNTDAEGRLILSDAITYAIKDLKAKEIITIATLTGSAVYALGNVFTGYFSTNEKLANAIKNAAFKSGEYVWRMPLHEKYYKAVKSGTLIADCINSPNMREAGSTIGAEFLHLFVDKNIDFAHFDIAGTSEFVVKGVSTPVPALLCTLYNLINYERKQD